MVSSGGKLRYLLTAFQAKSPLPRGRVPCMKNAGAFVVMALKAWGITEK